MQIPINKEIRHYQEEIFLGLNLRQMICSGAAIAVAVAVYLGLTPLLGHETAGWVCIVAAAPIAAAGDVYKRQVCSCAGGGMQNQTRTARQL